jgi:hypothetical protein
MWLHHVGGLTRRMPINHGQRLVSVPLALAMEAGAPALSDLARALLVRAANSQRKTSAA